MYVRPNACTCMLGLMLVRSLVEIGAAGCPIFVLHNHPHDFEIGQSN